jgi:mono/diheme cytochrome c family protein
MKQFLWGVVITLIALGLGAFYYLGKGYLNTRADSAPSKFETHWAMHFLDASVDRHAPHESSPVPATQANLLEGVKLYKANCAHCHGAPGHPEKEFGHPFYPPAPNFTEEAPDMPENQNFYIIKHGVRWSGMPAWESVLSDEQIWELTTFLSHLNKLPPAVQEEWNTPVGLTSGPPEKSGPK